MKKTLQAALWIALAAVLLALVAGGLWPGVTILVALALGIGLPLATKSWSGLGLAVGGIAALGAVGIAISGFVAASPLGVALTAAAAVSVALHVRDTGSLLPK